MPDEYEYLTAQYADNDGETVCTIKFSSGSGTGEMDNVEVLAGDKYVLPFCAFTAPDDPEGTIFKCWSILGKEYQPLQEITIEENTTVNAEWRAPQLLSFYYRSYVLKDGTVNAKYLDVRLVYDDNSEEPLSVADDCEFYLGNEQIPTNLIDDVSTYAFTQKGNNIVSVKYIHGKGDYQSASAFVTVREEFTISFNANGGDGTITDVVRLENTKFVLPAKDAFTAPNNKEFKCWLVGDIEKQPNDEITVTDNVQVKAVWQDITYIVSFDENGGSGNMAIVEKVLGAYTLPQNGFVAPQGKVFKGWALTENGDVIGTATTNIAANTTLYAIWEYHHATIGGVEVYDSTFAQGQANNVAGIFALAKAANGRVKLTVGDLKLEFNTSAVSAIGGSAASITANVLEENFGIEGLAGIQSVIEITFTGATFINGSVHIELPFATAVPNGKVAKVYYVNGNEKTDMNAVFTDGKVTFDTTHFSAFAVVFEDAPASPGDPVDPAPIDPAPIDPDPVDPDPVDPQPSHPSSNNTEEVKPVPEKSGLSAGAIAGIVIAIVIVLAGAGVGVFFLLKKKGVVGGKKTDEPKNDGEPKDESKDESNE